MPNKKQIRMIARNIIAKTILLADTSNAKSLLTKEEGKQLDKDMQSLAHGMVKRTYRSKEWDTKMIVGDILENT